VSVKAAAFNVLLTRGAEQDLESLYDYIAATDGAASAGKVLDRLMEAAASLEQAPERGSFPKELAALGIAEYRQILLKPWRVIYRVAGRNVIIHLIVDGRRDMQSLLQRRLLNR
jgi:toxin ParE1/3/4